MRGRSARARGDRARARAEWHTAVADTERLHHALLAAHCRLDLGLLDRDRGDGGAARAALGAAATAFRTIGATAWASEAETALGAM